jgi:hypothetical protein
MQNEDKYYLLYEDRCRRLNDHGFEYWIWNPEEDIELPGICGNIYRRLY